MRLPLGRILVDLLLLVPPPVGPRLDGNETAGGVGDTSMGSVCVAWETVIVGEVEIDTVAEGGHKIPPNALLIGACVACVTFT